MAMFMYRGPPISASSGLTVAINFGSGPVANFTQTGATDMGDFIGTFVRQKCAVALDPNYPDWRVYFRVDADSSGNAIVQPAAGWRDEVVVEYGRSTHGTPSHLLTSYTVTIAKAGTTVYTTTVPVQFWYSRWRYQSSVRGVVRTPATLKTLGWILNYGTTGMYGRTTHPSAVAWGGPFSAPSDPADGTSFDPYMADVGEHQQIGPLTEAAADYMIYSGAGQLTTLRTEGEWMGNAPWHIREDSTNGMLDVRNGPTGGVKYWTTSGGTINTYPGFGPSGGTPPSGQPAFIAPDPSHMYPCANAGWMLTEDPFLLEEMQFSINWSLLQNWNGNSRQVIAKGIAPYYEGRDYAWTLRDMLTAAKTTPASVPIWLQPASYYQSCVDENAAFIQTKYVNSTARLFAMFNCWTRSDDQPSWMQAWLSIISGLAVQMGNAEWLPIFNWSINQQIQQTNGTSGWPRDWPSPYYAPFDRGWPAREAATNIWFLSGTGSDATSCTSWADAWSYYKSGGGGISDSTHGTGPPFPIDDSSFDGLSIKEQTIAAAYIAPTFFFYTRCALAMGIQLGAPGAQACYDYMNTQMSATILPHFGGANAALCDEARYSLEPPSGGNVLSLVGNNTIRSQDPDPHNTSVYRGADGITGIITNSGASFAPNLGTLGSILIFGGGDNDYRGNEVFAFDIATAVANGPAPWSMITQPSSTGALDGTTAAAFTGVGSQTLGVLTVSSVTAGTLKIGQQVVQQIDTFHYGGVSGNTIASFGTGTGGVGTYNMNKSQTLASGSILFAGDPLFNYQYCEYGDGHPGAFHTYQSVNVVAGGTSGKGQMLCYNVQYTYFDIVGLYSHALDLGASPPTWSRFMGAPNGSQLDTYIQGSTATCYDASRNRIWAVGANGIASRIAYLDLTTGIHGSVSCPSALGLGIIQVSARNPVRGLMLYCGIYIGTPSVIGLRAIDLANPNLGSRAITLTGDTLPTSTSYLGSTGFDWDTIHDVGYIWSAGTFTDPGDYTNLYQIKPPASGNYFTDPWVIKQIPLPGSLPPSYQSLGINSHFLWIPTIGKFAIVSGVDDQVTLWAPPTS